MKKPATLFLLLIILMCFSCSKSSDDEAENNNSSTNSNANQLLFDGQAYINRLDGFKAQNENGIFIAKQNLGEYFVTVSFLNFQTNQLNTIQINGDIDVHHYYLDQSGDLLISGTVFSSSNVNSGRVFAIRLNDSLNVVWQKKYDFYSLPYYDSYYYNSISNIKNNKLVVCNMQWMFIIDATTGLLIKAIENNTTYHWLRNVAVADGFYAFGRLGSDAVIAKFDWQGNNIFMKKASDTRPDALLTSSVPIITSTDKIIWPYNTFQYNATGLGGYMVFDLNGNLIDHWNHQFSIDNTQGGTNFSPGGISIEEFGLNKYYLRGLITYSINEEGQLLSNKYHQGSVFSQSTGSFLQFQSQGSVVTQSEYIGVFNYNPNQICTKISIADLNFLNHNIDLIPYNFTDVSGFSVSDFMVDVTDLNVSIVTQQFVNITYQDKDYCNVDLIE
ncbi:hypothetical protein [Mesoflavibacter sp. CH_XMU1404-2]|uniref:hypothetical protein n=1 Tax=Mesoflavibacter sp. CH_XMU1404-2 TaxID=3107766 RepID=UPI00243C3FBB